MILRNTEETPEIFRQLPEPNDQNFTILNGQSNVYYFVTEDHGTFTRVNVLREDVYPNNYTYLSRFDCIQTYIGVPVSFDCHSKNDLCTMLMTR